MYIVLTYVFGILLIVLLVAFFAVFAWQNARAMRFYKAFVLSSTAIDWLKKTYEFIDVDIAILYAKREIERSIKECTDGKCD